MRRLGALALFVALGAMAGPARADEPRSPEPAVQDPPASASPSSERPGDPGALGYLPWALPPLGVGLLWYVRRRRLARSS